MRKVWPGSLLCALTFAFVALSTASFGCGSHASPSVLRKDRTVDTTEYNMDVAVTIGNRSYIPINQDGAPSDNVDMILRVLGAFEKAHPELTVTDWKIEKQQKAYTTGEKIFGIWVDHRPKGKKIDKVPSLSEEIPMP